MPVSITWLEPLGLAHRLAPAQLQGLGRRSEIKYGLQLLPSCSQICTSLSEGLWGEATQDPDGLPQLPDHSGLVSEQANNLQWAFQYKFITGGGGRGYKRNSENTVTQQQWTTIKGHNYF